MRPLLTLYGCELYYEPDAGYYWQQHGAPERRSRSFTGRKAALLNLHALGTRRIFEEEENDGGKHGDG